MSLEKEIQSAIEANLPAATAKILAERLQLGEEAIAENIALKAQADELADVIRLREDVRCREIGLAQKENDFKIKSQAFEIKQAVLEATQKITSERNNDIFRLVETVFKNPVVRTQSYGSTPVANGSGGWNTVPTSNTTTLEVEGN